MMPPLILGSTDTTSATLTLILDKQIGRERQCCLTPNSSQRNVVFIYPAGPLLAPHESSEDCIVGGYHIDPSRHRLLVKMLQIFVDIHTCGHICASLGQKSFLERTKTWMLEARILN
ncbi:hypothetical protein TorRG33x02_050020 [Trema orientale]|uniref:Uncharacterized protein n=1 Tax=Trema orientale TaxID=63057 RepID=A0A2P5FMW7_TREOI|nr:hypothetical protein TorRG33x02_050020 [Trema orientale]